jgi:hypothetical protein
VIVLLLEAVDFEVTTTVAVHNTPGVKPVMFTLLSAATLDAVVLNTDELSASFVTETSILTPAVGNVELTFTLIVCEVPTTPKIFPDPGSCVTLKATAASVGVGVGVGVRVGVSPPLLQALKTKGTIINNSLNDFIIKVTDYLKMNKNFCFLAVW